MVSTLTENDFPNGLKMIPLVNILLDHFLPENPEIAFSKIISNSRNFLQFCNEDQLYSILKDAFGTKKEFDKNTISEFLYLCNK